jgi:hypothetical protein
MRIFLNNNYNFVFHIHFKKFQDHTKFKYFSSYYIGINAKLTANLTFSESIFEIWLLFSRRDKAQRVLVAKH